MPQTNHAKMSFKQHLLHAGRYLSSGEKYGVAQGAKAVILIRNTSDDKVFYIEPPHVRSEAKCTVTKYYNPGSTSGETNVSSGITNKNPEASYSSEAEIRKGFTFTGGDSFSPKVLGSSATGIRAGGSNGHSSNILPPGNEMIVETVNNADSSGDKDISIDLDWYEVNV